MRRAAALVIAALALCTPAKAQKPQTELLLQAVASYTRGLNTEERDERLEEFRRAERLFARVAASGIRNDDLYTNSGNAALQAERMGSAVLAYRRALLLDPDQPRALQNLEHARALLPEWVPRPEASGLLDTFFVWHHTLPRSQRAVAAAFCFAAMALLVTAAIRLQQTALRNAALLPGLLWLALVTSVLLDPAADAMAEAVVTADEAVARSADSALAPMTFPQPLPGGVEVRILERRSPWLRVRLANGRDAWVAESSITPVAQPAD